MQGQDARLIATLMAATVSLALIGHTFEAKKGQSKLNPKVGDAQILLGGAVAATLLVLIDQAGEPGAALAKGLAVLALLAALGLYATPALKAIDNVTGQSTAKPAKSTPPPAKVTT